ncbi:MAG: Chorismate binding-like protein [Gemmataceae bacterium]|nr:Chorismate binding-like protein [Gemmataceae bacterium]
MNAGIPARFEAVPVSTPADGPLVVELVPAPDAWDVVRRLRHFPHLLFFDSAERHVERGRYSYITADPTVWAANQLHGLPATPFDDAALMTNDVRFPTVPGLPPYQGGLAGLFGYGLNRILERRVPAPRFDEFPSPVLALGVYDWVVSFDHKSGRAWLISTGFEEGDAGPEEDRLVQAEYRQWQVLEALKSAVLTTRPPSPAAPMLPPSAFFPQHPVPGFPGVTSNFDRAGYEAAVARAVGYIHAGDCFQVNLSQRLLAPLREHPLDLYGRLRTLNPAPFAGYFDLGDYQILSASPERFLRVGSGEVETRPIKGTRPRGRTPTEDAALIADLAASPKDRAENVMIVDLMRNDLGRVCEYGSVRVPRVCEVETFRYVHHLVSEVRGKLRPDCGPLDLLRAAFPGGSVTGAPKVRAMEIIAELEPTARGPYCGSLGFIGFDGTMDTNILIRTFTAGRGWVQFPVGGGVVADSDPCREYEETLHKAAGLLRALEAPGATFQVPG